MKKCIIGEKYKKKPIFKKKHYVFDLEEYVRF